MLTKEKKEKWFKSIREGDLYCPMKDCTWTFFTSFELANHLKTSCEYGRYDGVVPCTHCPVEEKFEGLTSHWRRTHREIVHALSILYNKKKTKNCANYRCSRVFEGTFEGCKEYLKHSITCSPLFVCDKCKGEYKTRINLEKHRCILSKTPSENSVSKSEVNVERDLSKRPILSASEEKEHLEKWICTVKQGIWCCPVPSCPKQFFLPKHFNAHLTKEALVDKIISQITVIPCVFCCKDIELKIFHRHIHNYHREISNILHRLKNGEELTCPSFLCETKSLYTHKNGSDYIIHAKYCRPLFKCEKCGLQCQLQSYLKKHKCDSKFKRHCYKPLTMSSINTSGEESPQLKKESMEKTIKMENVRSRNKPMTSTPRMKGYGCRRRPRLQELCSTATSSSCSLTSLTSNDSFLTPTSPRSCSIDINENRSISERFSDFKLQKSTLDNRTLTQKATVIKRKNSKDIMNKEKSVENAKASVKADNRQTKNLTTSTQRKKKVAKKGRDVAESTPTKFSTEENDVDSCFNLDGFFTPVVIRSDDTTENHPELMHQISQQHEEQPTTLEKEEQHGNTTEQEQNQELQTSQQAKHRKQSLSSSSTIVTKRKKDDIHFIGERRSHQSIQAITREWLTDHQKGLWRCIYPKCKETFALPNDLSSHISSYPTDDKLQKHIFSGSVKLTCCFCLTVMSLQGLLRHHKKHEKYFKPVIDGELTCPFEKCKEQFTDSSLYLQHACNCPVELKERDEEKEEERRKASHTIWLSLISTGLLICGNEACGKVCDTPEKMLEHLQSCTVDSINQYIIDKQDLTCPWCKESIQLQDFQEHTIEAHSQIMNVLSEVNESSKFSCPNFNCAYVCDKVKNFQQHSVACTPCFLCDDCRCTFTQYRNFKNHECLGNDPVFIEKSLSMWHNQVRSGLLRCINPSCSMCSCDLEEFTSHLLICSSKSKFCKVLVEKNMIICSFCGGEFKISSIVEHCKEDHADVMDTLNELRTAGRGVVCPNYKCSIEFTDGKRYFHHASICKPLYNCDDCSIDFGSKKLLIDHVCPQINKRKKEERLPASLIQDWFNEIKTGNFTCPSPKCKQKSKTYDTLLSHLRTCRKDKTCEKVLGDDKLLCCFCMTEVTLSKFNIHMESTHPKILSRLVQLDFTHKIKCLKRGCKMSFNDRGKFIQHFVICAKACQQKHDGLRLPKKHTFDRLKWLNDVKDGVLRCPNKDCVKEFFIIENFITHLKSCKVKRRDVNEAFISSIDKLPCLICKKEFNSNELPVHFRTDHTVTFAQLRLVSQGICIHCPTEDCKQAFMDGHAYLKHASGCFQRTELSCQYCKQKFSTEENQSIHICAGKRTTRIQGQIFDKLTQTSWYRDVMKGNLYCPNEKCHFEFVLPRDFVNHLRFCSEGNEVQLILKRNELPCCFCKRYISIGKYCTHLKSCSEEKAKAATAFQTGGATHEANSNSGSSEISNAPVLKPDIPRKRGRPRKVLMPRKCHFSTSEDTENTIVTATETDITSETADAALFEESVRHEKNYSSGVETGVTEVRNLTRINESISCDNMSQSSSEDTIWKDVTNDTNTIMDITEEGLDIPNETGNKNVYAHENIVKSTKTVVETTPGIRLETNVYSPDASNSTITVPSQNTLPTDESTKNNSELEPRTFNASELVRPTTIHNLSSVMKVTVTMAIENQKSSTETTTTTISETNSSSINAEKTQITKVPKDISVKAVNVTPDPTKYAENTIAEIPIITVESENNNRNKSKEEKFIIEEVDSSQTSVEEIPLEILSNEDNQNQLQKSDISIVSTANIPCTAAVEQTKQTPKDKHETADEETSPVVIVEGDEQISNLEKVRISQESVEIRVDNSTTFSDVMIFKKSQDNEKSTLSELKERNETLIHDNLVSIHNEEQEKPMLTEPRKTRSSLRNKSESQNGKSIEKTTCRISRKRMIEKSDNIDGFEPVKRTKICEKESVKSIIKTPGKNVNEKQEEKAFKQITEKQIEKLQKGYITLQEKPLEITERTVLPLDESSNDRNLNELFESTDTKTGLTMITDTKSKETDQALDPCDNKKKIENSTKSSKGKIGGLDKECSQLLETCDDEKNTSTKSHKETLDEFDPGTRQELDACGVVQSSDGDDMSSVVGELLETDQDTEEVMFEEDDAIQENKEDTIKVGYDVVNVKGDSFKQKNIQNLAVENLKPIDKSDQSINFSNDNITRDNLRNVEGNVDYNNDSNLARNDDKVSDIEIIIYSKNKTHNKDTVKDTATDMNEPILIESKNDHKEMTKLLELSEHAAIKDELEENGEKDTRAKVNISVGTKNVIEKHIEFTNVAENSNNINRDSVDNIEVEQSSNSNKDNKINENTASPLKSIMIVNDEKLPVPTSKAKSKPKLDDTQKQDVKCSTEVVNEITRHKPLSRRFKYAANRMSVVPLAALKSPEIKSEKDECLVKQDSPTREASITEKNELDSFLTPKLIKEDLKSESEQIPSEVSLDGFRMIKHVNPLPAAPFLDISDIDFSVEPAESTAAEDGKESEVEILMGRKDSKDVVERIENEDAMNSNCEEEKKTKQKTSPNNNKKEDSSHNDLSKIALKELFRIAPSLTRSNNESQDETEDSQDEAETETENSTSIVEGTPANKLMTPVELKTPTSKQLPNISDDVEFQEGQAIEDALNDLFLSINCDSVKKEEAGRDLTEPQESRATISAIKKNVDKIFEDDEIKTQKTPQSNVHEPGTTAGEDIVSSDVGIDIGTKQGLKVGKSNDSNDSAPLLKIKKPVCNNEEVQKLSKHSKGDKNMTTHLVHNINAKLKIVKREKTDIEPLVLIETMKENLSVSKWIENVINFNFLCPFCHMLTLRLNTLQRHMKACSKKVDIQNYFKENIKCPECDYNNLLDRLVNHFRNRHLLLHWYLGEIEKGNWAVCQNWKCAKYMDQAGEIREHTHTCGYLWRCKYCLVEYEKESLVKKHKCRENMSSDEGSDLDVDEKSPHEKNNSIDIRSVEEKEVIKIEQFEEKDKEILEPPRRKKKRVTLPPKPLKREDDDDDIDYEQWANEIRFLRFNCKVQGCGPVNFAQYRRHINGHSKNIFAKLFSQKIKCLVASCKQDTNISVDNYVKHLRNHHLLLWNFSKILDSDKKVHCFDYECDNQITSVEELVVHFESCKFKWKCPQCSKVLLSELGSKIHKCDMMYLREEKIEDEKTEEQQTSGRAKRKSAAKALSILSSIKESQNIGGENNNVDVCDDVYDDDEDSDFLAKVDDCETESEEYEDDESEDIENDDVSESDNDTLNTSTYSKFVPANKLAPYSSKTFYERWLTEHKSDDIILPSLMPTPADFEVMNKSSCVQYFPTSTTSPSIEIEYCLKKSNEKRKLDKIQLQIFQAFEPLEGSSSMGFYCGGPVWGMDWCPAPGDSDQFLAVTSLHAMGERHCTSYSSTEEGIIQIWGFGKLHENPTPNLMYGFCHNYGPIFEVKWCPELYSAEKPEIDDRLGLLAAACGDGKVRIFSIPRPTSKSAVFGCMKPCITLSPSKRDTIETINHGCCLCLSWQSSGQRRKIVAGFGDGSVCIWDILTNSILLKRTDENGRIELLPIISTDAHSHAVRSICWCPYNDDIIATCSSDKSTKVLNIHQPNNPLYVFKRGIFFNMDWPKKRLGFFSTEDDCFNIIPSSARYLIMDNFIAPVKEDPKRAICTTRHTSAVWSCSYNNHLDFMATGDSTGEVHVDKDLDAQGTKPNTIRKKTEPVFRVLRVPLKEGLSIDDSQPLSGTNNILDSYKANAEKTLKSFYKYKYKMLDSNNFEFSRHRLKSDKEFSRICDTSLKNIPDFDDLETRSINKVIWNENYGSHTWLASGTRFGIVRLHNFKAWAT